MKASLRRDDGPNFTSTAHVPCEDWSDQENSDPITDVDDAVGVFVAATAHWPHALIVDLEAHHALQRHPLILDRLKITSLTAAGIRPTPLYLASIFDVDAYEIEGVHPDPRTSFQRERTFDDAINLRARLCARRLREELRKEPLSDFGQIIPEGHFLRAGLTEKEVADLFEYGRAVTTCLDPKAWPSLSPFLSDFCELLREPDR